MINWSRLWLSLGLVLALNVNAQTFQLGETVFVGLPSINIKDDAFIIGEVTKQLDNGDYQIKVQDYVEGHDYGAFCQPVAVVEGDSGKTPLNSTNRISSMLSQKI